MYTRKNAISVYDQCRSCLKIFGMSFEAIFRQVFHKSPSIQPAKS